MVNRLSSVAMVTSVAVSNALHHLRGRVLDVGCGSKPYKRLVYGDSFRDPFTEWVGLDIRPVGEIEADMMEMPVEDESFDSVLCVNALQYAINPILALSEMVRVLKPGGVMLLVAPNVDAEDESAFFSFKMRGLLELTSQLGMELIEAKTASKLFTHEFQNYGNTEAGLTWPGSMQSRLEYLDEMYPAINVVVCRKAT